MKVITKTFETKNGTIIVNQRKTIFGNYKIVSENIVEYKKSEGVKVY